LSKLIKIDAVMRPRVHLMVMILCCVCHFFCDSGKKQIGSCKPVREEGCVHRSRTFLIHVRQFLHFIEFSTLFWNTWLLKPYLHDSNVAHNKCLLGNSHRDEFEFKVIFAKECHSPPKSQMTLAPRGRKILISGNFVQPSDIKNNFESYSRVNLQRVPKFHKKKSQHPLAWTINDDRYISVNAWRMLIAHVCNPY
jgi:hypothetical protein